MGRHKLYRDRKPCKHIKEILNESGGKKWQKNNQY
jgi:hypothetical protein